MKHIKKFNELFDTDSLQSEFEIPMLKGDFDIKDVVNKTIKSGWIKPTKLPDNLQKLHSKVTRIFPYINATLDRVFEDVCGLTELEFETLSYWFKDGVDGAICTISVIGFDDYEVTLSHFDLETNQVYEHVEYTDCKFKQVVGILKDLHNILKGMDLDDVLGYDKDADKQYNN